MSLKISIHNAFLLMIAVLIFLAGCGADSQYIKEGEQYTKKGQWDEAVRHYQELLEKYPDDKEIKLLLSRSKLEASISHLARGKALLKKNLFDNAAREFEKSAELNPSSSLSLMLMKKAKNRKEAFNLIQEGENAIKQGDVFKAQNAFQRALELDRENKKARKLMAEISKKEKYESDIALRISSKKPVSFKFKNTPIINVFEVLSKLSNINFIFDKDMVNSKVTMFMTDVSFDRFISVLLKTNNLSAKLMSSDTMLIYPDTPSKNQEYKDLKIRTFYLANLDAQKGVSLLSKIMKSKNIMANKELNAIIVRGEEEEIEIASRILEANDQPPSEVLLNVEILEVSRTKEKQLGLDINPSAITIGIGEAFENVDDDAGLVNTASLSALEDLSDKEIMLSIPTATLNLLKQDGDTKMLASPQIRVINNEKATIHIGERIPLRTNRRVDTNGDITYDFQYQDIGVKLDATPTINVNGEISLNINLEVSSLGPNIGTVDDPQYSIKARTAKSVLSVRGGEPVIIGGLISDEERETLRKIPYVGEIPIIGRLFTTEGGIDSQKDILMSITPFVIRGQEIPEKNITEMWSGSENTFSLQKPFRSYSDGNRMKPSPKPDEKDDIKTNAVEEETAEEKINDVDQKESVKNDFETIENYWPPSVNYSIHVNSYKTLEEVGNRIQELTLLGYECLLVYADVPEKGPYYRIFVGRFGDLSSAQAVCDEFKNRKEFAKDIHPVSRNWAFTGHKG